MASIYAEVMTPRSKLLLPVLGALACQPGLEAGRGPAPQEADADTDADSDADTDADSDADSDTDTDSDTDADPVESDMIWSPDLPNVEQDPLLLKGIQPDFWPNPDELSGNMAGSVAMNLVWAAWQPEQKPTPCDAGEVAYDGWCFRPDANTDAAITQWTDRGLAVTAVVYGVPEWARQDRPCSPVAAGFEIFCVPDDPDDYGTFAGFLARRYNGANGVGLAQDFVIHNEVNSNSWFDVGCGQGTPCDTTEWTSIYVDNYLAAFDAIRLEQAEARVFVSLEHHFASPDYDLPSAEQPLIAGQTMLRAVAAAAGSRDWRVAYHPYPPDLLSPEFSADDWPRVTYGNLGALPGWLHQEWPGSAAATDIHLTESGINSLTGSSQAAQAAAVCDSFTNVLGTPGVSRYIYHRMQDHPDETAAGLGLGLWGSDGLAKAAWSTWALANRFDLDPQQLSCGFEHLPYTQLTRAYSASRGHWASSRLPPEGFAEERSWRLWRAQQPDTTLLFECAVGEHNLLSPDAACEGLLALGPVGWIEASPGDGRVALYRCIVSSTGDHFISDSPTCEGQTVEQLLGYALEAP